ncbi:MAG: DUF4286 family protein [Ferruginibacter sp.]|nr:DUF4286 family protein [Ferruginibacter sp.]
MIIYNVTIKVASPIQNEWLNWMKEVYIPDMMNTGCFTGSRILRLLETDDTEGPTYAIQYFAESKAIYNRYIENFAGTMLQKSFDKWGDQFFAFMSVLQVVN